MYNSVNMLNKLRIKFLSGFRRSASGQKHIDSVENTPTNLPHQQTTTKSTLTKEEYENLPFGMHLMFDAYNCDPTVLDDSNVLYTLLEGLPGKLGMRPMIKPYIVRTLGNDKRDPGGWSGFVLIEESHISFHTFVKRKFVTVDIYTCTFFDADKATRELKKFFKTEDTETIVETRGKRYPNANLI